MGTALSADLEVGNTLQVRYVQGDGVNNYLADVVVGATHWVLTDQLGSTRDITDSSGAVIDTITYEGFGKMTGESTSANGGCIKYAGGESDAETGNTVLRQRFYDPTTGGWLSEI